MSDEKIINKHCFIKKKSSNKVYCSKCGKVVYQDYYNLKKHKEACGITDNGFLTIYRENQDFVAAFRGTEQEFSFFVFTPILQERPGFSEVYSGGSWKQVYRCSFEKQGKVFKEKGLQNLAYWTEYFSKNNLTLLNEKSLNQILYDNFHIPGMKSLDTFIRIYHGKGYRYQELLSDEVSHAKLSMKMAYQYKGESLIPRLGYLGKVYGKLTRAEDRTSPILHINIRMNHEKESLQFLVAENFFYTESDLPLRDLLLRRFEYDVPDAELEEFDRCYPSFGLMNYIKAGGKNILIPLLAANYDPALELLAKSGCADLADCYEFVQQDKTVNLQARNLKEMFGLPVSILKKIKMHILEVENGILVLQEVHKKAPRYLQVEEISNCYLMFLKENVLTELLKRRTAIQGFRQMDEIWKLRIARYLSNRRNLIDYNYYVDYMNMCHTGREYVCGYTPENILNAHNMALFKFSFFMEEKMKEKFLQRVSSEKYLERTMENDEDAYLIRAPKNVEELWQEGRTLHHCVGSYDEKVANGYTQIFFLREKKAKEVPFATIEVRGNQLVQLKAKCNQKAPTDAQRFVRKWAFQHQIQINTIDM